MFLDHCIYKDDIYIFCRINDIDRTKTVMSQVFCDILNWCTTSGAILSLDKCKTLHVCRKLSCPCSFQSSKNNTSDIIFSKLFFETTTDYKAEGWNTIFFTNGSKSINCFAITTYTTYQATKFKSLLQSNLTIHTMLNTFDHENLNSFLNNAKLVI